MIAKGDGVDGIKGVNGINEKIRFRFCSKMQLVLFLRLDVFSNQEPFHDKYSTGVANWGLQIQIQKAFAHKVAMYTQNETVLNGKKHTNLGFKRLDSKGGWTSRGEK